tara:strand:+ start:198 stop:668 length:471 start_codon:yes stop_codon:yes gene_type:complete
MAGSVNKVILIGNLGRDPEIKTFQSGGRVANLSLATSESWKDRDSGEKREKTEWHRVAIFNEKLIDIVEKFVKKGSKLYLEGQLETRKWQDQNGQDKYTTEIVLRNFRGEVTLLDRINDNQRDDYGEENTLESKKENMIEDESVEKADNIDDEIPF